MGWESVESLLCPHRAKHFGAVGRPLQGVEAQPARGFVGVPGVINGEIGFSIRPQHKRVMTRPDDVAFYPAQDAWPAFVQLVIWPHHAVGDSATHAVAARIPRPARIK